MLPSVGHLTQISHEDIEEWNLLVFFEFYSKFDIGMPVVEGGMGLTIMASSSLLR